MSQIQTLTDFLNATSHRFRIFDMGRRISKLSPQDFLRFEQDRIPYPLPLMQQAFLAILIWNPKQVDQHQIWFLKFPLDEQGKLIFAARDDLLRRLASMVGKPLLDSSEDNDPLKDNPFSFTPDQEKMAAFHAIASQALGQPPSDFYRPARDYMAGNGAKGGYEHWQELGLQGIADMVARLQLDGNEELITSALPALPHAPLEAIAINLENQQAKFPLYQALADCLLATLKDERCNANTLGALLRGLSQCPAEELLQDSLQAALRSPWGKDIELLAAVGSRCWQALNNNRTRTLFFDNLAENSAGQASFNAMSRDLLFMPGLRILIMETFRNPERSDALAKAIGAFLIGSDDANGNGNGNGNDSTAGH